MILLFKVTGMNTPQSPPVTYLVNMTPNHAGHKKQPRAGHQTDNDTWQYFHDISC